MTAAGIKTIECCLSVRVADLLVRLPSPLKQTRARVDGLCNRPLASDNIIEDARAPPCHCRSTQWLRKSSSAVKNNPCVQPVRHAGAVVAETKTQGGFNGSFARQRGFSQHGGRAEDDIGGVGRYVLLQFCTCSLASWSITRFNAADLGSTTCLYWRTVLFASVEFLQSRSRLAPTPVCATARGRTHIG